MRLLIRNGTGRLNRFYKTQLSLIAKEFHQVSQPFVTDIVARGNYGLIENQYMSIQRNTLVLLNNLNH
jgi:hypothetical protein